MLLVPWRGHTQCAYLVPHHAYLVSVLSARPLGTPQHAPDQLAHEAEGGDERAHTDVRGSTAPAAQRGRPLLGGAGRACWAQPQRRQ